VLASVGLGLPSIALLVWRQRLRRRAVIAMLDATGVLFAACSSISWHGQAPLRYT